MAAYPDFHQVLGSDPTYVDDRTMDSDVNGAVHIRAFYAGRKNQFQLKHHLSRSDFATLLTFYDAHRLDFFDFLYHLDEVTYSCVFMSAPKVSTAVDPQIVEVTVQLRQVS